MEKELIAINVIIADRSYRLKIKPEEEEAVRKSIKEVNDRILEFKTAYAGKDIQDYIAMALILYATQPAAPAVPATSDPDTAARLRGLENLLDEVLA